MKFLKIALCVQLALTITRTSADIHILGDSHSSFSFRLAGLPIIPYIQFLYSTTRFHIHWLGPRTMHGIGRDGIDIRPLGIQENDVAVYVFGEIDVRCHIGKQRDMQKKSLDEIIDMLATNYCSAILDQTKLYTHLTSVVFAVIPPISGKIRNNKNYPFYGTLEDRVVITKTLNARLEQLCQKNNIGFFSVYDSVCTPEGSLREEIADYSVHIAMEHNDFIRKGLLAYLSDKNCSYTRDNGVTRNIDSHRAPFVNAWMLLVEAWLFDRRMHVHRN